MPEDFLSQNLNIFDRHHIWHPFTQMKDFEHRDMPVITRGEGLKLYDNRGNEFYDCISSWWCILHGHNHPKIKNAIKEQLDSLEQVIFAGFTHEKAIQLAHELLYNLPSHLSKFFFSDNGSTACEVALKMSYQQRLNNGEKKTKFIAFDRGYHGDTLGAMSVSGLSQFSRKFEGLFFDCHRIASPYCYRCEFGCKSGADCNLECLKPLEKLLREKSSEITAIILEPLVFGAGGMIFYPVRHLENLIKLVKAHDIHIIFDEIATGFGRLGRMFAMDFLDENLRKPDFLCISKGLTGGFLPLALTITTNDIFNSFFDDYEKNKTFFHGHTFTANPLGCAAALASTKIFKEENTLENIRGKISFLQKEKEKFSELPIVGDVRGMGMICAFELVKDKKTKEPFDSRLRTGWKIYNEGLKKGLIIRPLGDVIYLFLPLSTQKTEISYILDTLFEILKDFR
jgi:adenosylmethionine-8-amino-7-oxononanoate aminotransferase